MPYTSLPTVVSGESVATVWGNLVDSNLDDHEARIARAGAVAAGVVTVSYTALNTAASAAVLFPAGRFTVEPRVSATVMANAPLQFTPATVLAKTISGFTVYLAKIAGAVSGTVNVEWIAVQPY